jgi:tetratricopeptide (TPR) repeat protein
MGESDIARLYMEYAQHADPLVRTSAVQGLEMLAGMGNDAARQILVRKLEDADRSVRVAAAWGLRGSVDMASRAGSELGHSLELSADQPTGQLALGALAQARGKVDDAIFHFKRAVDWDSKSAALRHEYAVFLAGIERPAESLAQMREAVRLEPKNAEFRYKLALALNETGGLSAAIPEFENAVRIDPKHSRAWYNLGLARNQMRDVKGAVDALLQAEKADPTDPRIPYARATIHAATGQTDEARAAAERALQIAPNMPEARQFLGR